MHIKFLYFFLVIDGHVNAHLSAHQSILEIFIPGNFYDAFMFKRCRVLSRSQKWPLFSGTFYKRWGGVT